MDAAIRDPKPSVERIEELARRIIESDILLPKFQRDFVWNRAQIIDLFDSISKNYPIGSILLWLSKQKLRSEVNIAGLPFKERPDEYPVNYLLDGQQRLSCICGALFWKPVHGDEDSVWNIAYDLKTKKFIHLSTTDEPPVHQIRLNKFPDASKYFAHVASLQQAGEAGLATEAERFFALLKSYSIASVTLHDMPIEDVAPIFERINSTGTKLTIVDLMRAATWSEEFDLVDTIDQQVLEAVSGKGFETIDRRAVLRVMSSASGFSFSTSGIDKLRDRTADQLKAAADSTVTAFKLATDFLHDQLKIPNAEVVPYVNQIVVMAELFRRKQTLSAQEVNALKHWFWRTTLSTYFSGWSSGQMDMDLQKIEEFTSGGSKELDIGSGTPPSSIWKSRSFRANTSLSKLLGLLLTQHDPRDLVSGQKVKLAQALAWQNNREFHHIFPQAFLKERGFHPPEINSLSNFALLSSVSNKTISDQAPSQYIRDCEKRIGADFAEVLASNLISPAAFDHLLADDFRAFRNQRSEDLHAAALKLCGY
ncbi:DUF262 domain-containing protein [Tabrizicola aquatica]|uniref:DUF262 domain-containing protein n=1 Tax=Tabrizicola aquatica TaxID=909926 RepID=UPI000CD1D05D|nr:DUF262 domain-containing protein [Tabrizicola aquatica]